MEGVRKIGVLDQYLVSYGKRYKIMAIVIKEDDLELLCDLSNGAIFNDLE